MALCLAGSSDRGTERLPSAGCAAALTCRGHAAASVINGQSTDELCPLRGVAGLQLRADCRCAVACRLALCAQSHLTQPLECESATKESGRHA